MNGVKGRKAETLLPAFPSNGVECEGAASSGSDPPPAQKALPLLVRPLIAPTITVNASQFESVHNTDLRGSAGKREEVYTPASHLNLVYSDVFL